MADNSLRYTIIVLIILLIGISLGYLIRGKETPFGYVPGANVFSGGVTNSSTTLAAATSTQILARNLDRQYALICNDGGDVAWIQFTATSIGDEKEGIPIASSTAYEKCYEIDSDNLYQGAVYGYAATESIVKYIEK